MTTFRFRLAFAVALTAGIVACSPEFTTADVLRSDLEGEELLDQFVTRVTYLADDKDNLVRELEGAGFRYEPANGQPTSPCGTYAYSGESEPREGVDPKLNAFVSFCLHGDEVNLRRFGINRGPMPQD